MRIRVWLAAAPGPPSGRAAATGRSRGRCLATSRRETGRLARLGVAASLASLVGLAWVGGLAGCRRSAAGAAAAAAAGLAGAGGAGAAGSPAEALVVRRGDLQPRLVLTGELKSERAQALVAPKTESFQLQIRWLAEDGAAVAAGQPVVEFDNSTFVAKLDEKRLAAEAAADELARVEAEARAAAADKSFAVEQARTDLEKARIAAAVPPELLPRRDYQERQLKRQQAETALAKAEEDLAAQRGAAAADAGVQRIALDQARREVAAAEAAIRDLTLRAPRAGLMLVGDHPWEGRKFHEGDNVWTGTKVATLPDLSSLSVEAALSDVDDGRVTAGMAATCFLDAYPEAPLRGRIAEVSPVARESSRSALLRSFAVRVELAPLAPAQAGRLRPGMSVRVEVAAAPVRGALLVPRAALDLTPRALRAALLTPRAPADDAAARRPTARALLAGGGAAAVRLGACDSFWCVAESGVREGQALRRRGVGETG
jgi:HlyD family secretion protein